MRFFGSNKICVCVDYWKICMCNAFVPVIATCFSMHSDYH